MGFKRKTMKSVLFYWGKGADVRRRIMLLIFAHEKKNSPSYLNLLAQEINQSHVTTRRHIELLLEEQYLEEQNPGGKPTYLTLTKKGHEIVAELRSA